MLDLRWLNDHGVACKQSRCDLADREDQGKVPGDNTTTNTEGRILSVDGLLIILKLLCGEIKRAYSGLVNYSGRHA
jgi:hypothetical protein